MTEKPKTPGLDLLRHASRETAMKRMFGEQGDMARIGSSYNKSERILLCVSTLVFSYEESDRKSLHQYIDEICDEREYFEKLFRGKR